VAASTGRLNCLLRILRGIRVALGNHPAITDDDAPVLARKLAPKEQNR
jgi:hypothetical protein